MNLRRAAANAALLIALSMILMFVVWMVLIPGTGVTQDDLMNPIKVGQFALGHRALWTILSLSDLVCGVALPFLTLALYRTFRKNQPGRATIIGIFGIMSSVLFFAAGAISMLAPNLVASLPNAAETFGALGAVQQPMEMAAIFLISVSTWHAVRAAHATKAFNAVTLYAGYLASLGVLVLPLTLISVEAGMLGYAPMIPSIVYQLGLTAKFMNTKSSQELEGAFAS